MKKLKFENLIASLVVLMLATSCSDDDNTGVTPNPTPVINAVLGGNWQITLYQDNGVNETNQYSNYVFTFGANNVLTAANSTDDFTGTWSVTNDDNSNDDSTSNDLDFNIAFVAPAPNNLIDDLTDDWDIISYSSTKVELIDVSGGNGGTDYLTFEKN